MDLGMRYIQLLFALFLLGSAASCTSLEEDLCSAECECKGCSDAAYDVCVNEHDADFRAADFRGCVDLYDEWLDCQDATAVCNGADWNTACKPEHDRFKNCTK